MKLSFGIFVSLGFVFLFVFGVNCVYGYFFPIKYSNEISYACNKFDVDESVIYSIINIESHFRKNARSNKGAVGLMQVMPSTAAEIAKELKLQSFDINNPQDNIVVGVCYFSKLVEKFGSVRVALCAYNAGPTKVQSWIKNNELTMGFDNTAKIPFPETMAYLEKFDKNFKYYSYRLS